MTVDCDVARGSRLYVCLSESQIKSSLNRGQCRVVRRWAIKLKCRIINMFSTSQWAEYCHGFVGCTYLYRINSFQPNDCAAQASSGSKEQPNCSRFPCNLETAHIRPMQSVVAAISAATFDSQPHTCVLEKITTALHITHR